jgi:hypothetical protein
MAEKKSILEEALLDITNIQNALNANTKEILRSVAKEEIDSVVKESLEEMTYEEEDVDALAGEAGEEDENEFDAESGMEDVDSEMGGSEIELPSMDTMGMDDEESSEELDMTGASDEDVIAIYKKMSGEDEIEIVGDELRLNITEPGEYVVKLDSLEGDSDMEMDVEMDDEELEAEPMEMGDEEDSDVEYDIEMGDDEEEAEHEDSESEEEEEAEHEEGGSEFGEEEEEEEEEEEIEENIANVNGRAGHQGQRRSGSSHLGFGKKSVDGEKLDETIKARQIVSETAKKYNNLLTEAKKLQTENQEFRTALKEFRNKLVETVVFNSNLTYVTRLFTEHSTTKAEKQNIIKRFDEVSNLKESKKLHKTISNELESRKPINESVERKIIKEASTSTSKQLNESTAYVDPSTKRIMDLINRVEKR